MKLNNIKQLQKNHFLHMYEASYTNEEGNEKKYEFISRNTELTKAQFEQGNEACAVGIIAFNETMDKILVLKEFRLACDRWLYNFPGGLIDEGETPLIAAKRELKEETGLEVVDFKYEMTPAVTAVGLSDERVYTVICTVKGDFKKSTSADEEIEAQWLTKDEVKELLESGALMSLRTQSFLWMWTYSDKLNQEVQ